LAAEFHRKSGIAGPDILVNNAGVITRGTVAKVTIDEYEQIFAVNVRAPFFLVQRFIPGFAAGGRIINISSRLSLLGPLGLVTYAMTKAAINAMTRGLATELGPSGITVNAVGPGSVETDINAERFAEPETRARIAAMAALKRTAKPDDIAGVVAFLASEDARWITGAYIEVAGGAGL
jgi:3-oxoacyl-[acyl-carrier protein] reductase